MNFSSTLGKIKIKKVYFDFLSEIHHVSNYSVNSYLNEVKH